MRNAEFGVRNEDQKSPSPAQGGDCDSALRTPHSALPDDSAFPPAGRLIGVDFGAVRVGLAACDPGRRVASALSTYVRRGVAADAAAFVALAKSEAAVGWVVGLAISLNGTEGPKAKECRAFGAWLRTATGLPVAFQDERFTTAAADDYLREAKLSPAKRKARRDRVAAQLILQSFLDAQRLPPGDHDESGQDEQAAGRDSGRDPLAE